MWGYLICFLGLSLIVWCGCFWVEEMLDILDGNCIGSNGMKLLSKAQIPKLGNLYMGNF